MDHSGRSARTPWLIRLVVPLFAALLGYLLIEVGYRVYTYYDIRNALLTTVLRQTPSPAGPSPSDVLAGNSIVDMHTGYRYRPNIQVQSSDPLPVAWRTNSHGHIARSEYTVAKSSGRFRIGLVGDSFTANVTNTIRWGDVLEDRLNASDAWLAITGGRRVRVINFGLDGLGVVQFDDVAIEMAVPFELDLLIVNLIREDVVRRPYYRGSATAQSAEQVASYIDAQMQSKLPFWSTYPQVIAMTLGDWLGMTPRLATQQGVELLGGPREYKRVENAVNASVTAVQRLRKYFPDAIFLVHPQYRDLHNSTDPTVRAAFEGFVQRLPELELVDMAAFLPKASSDEELDSWFNVPHDRHNSDLGLRRYGEAVAAYLIESRSASHIRSP